jgi:hypothetical protein
MGPDGTFNMPAVAAGNYDVALVLVSTGPENDLYVYVSAIRMRDDDVLAQGLHVNGPPSEPIEIILKANGGTVEIAVRTPKGEALPDAQAALLSDAPRPWSLHSAGRHSGRLPRIRIRKGYERRFSRSREHHRRRETGQARESHRRQPSELRARGVARRPLIWLPVPHWFSSVAPLITSAAFRPARKSSASEKRFARWPPAAGHRARRCARLPDQRRPSGRYTACHPVHR